MFQAPNHLIYIKINEIIIAGLIALKSHRYLVERLADYEGVRSAGSVIEAEGVCA